MMLLVATVQMAGANIADHVVISEIQADSNSGPSGDCDDWIELYNPTNVSINLSSGTYRIERAVTSIPSFVMRIGNEDDGTYPGGTVIPAYGFYLIVRDNANQTLRDKADAIGTKSTFYWTGGNYTLYLGNDTISSDDDPDIVDKVGFGSGAKYNESSPAPAIPDGKSLQRKVSDTVDESDTYGPAWDSDNNSADFFIQDSPNPVNSTMSSGNPVAPLPELPTIILTATGILVLAGYASLRRSRKTDK